MLDWRRFSLKKKFEGFFLSASQQFSSVGSHWSRSPGVPDVCKTFLLVSLSVFISSFFSHAALWWIIFIIIFFRLPSVRHGSMQLGFIHLHPFILCLICLLFSACLNIGSPHPETLETPNYLIFDSLLNIILLSHSIRR